MATHYIHGFSEIEQNRLSMMQTILNEKHLATLDFTGVSRVLDVGSGLGQMTRVIARRLGGNGVVIGVEKNQPQLDAAKQLAIDSKEQHLVDFRSGDATLLPLADDEIGSFDLVHTRFLLEHVSDPLAIVQQMVGAAKVEGRIFLMDDDHELLKVSPACSALERMWKIYWESYRALGFDPLIGRRLPELLVKAGAEIIEVNSLFYGATAGQPIFEAVVDNLLGVIGGTMDRLIQAAVASQLEFDQMLLEVADWRRQPAATVWYSLPYCVGVRNQ